MLLIPERWKTRFARVLGCGMALAVTLTAGAAPTRADSIGFMSPGGLTTGHDPGSPVNLGMLFTANTNFSVTSLGIYVDPGLSAPEVVGLYDNATQTLLASTTVALTDPVTDDYLFHAITPVALTAGHEYMVVTNVGDNSWSYGAAPIVSPDVSWIQNVFLYGNTLAFPTDDGGSGPAYYGPNFTIGAVPEPSSLVLCGTAAAALAALWGRRLTTAHRPPV